MKGKFLLVAVLLIAADAAAAQSHKAETAIREVMQNQAAAWNRGDIDGFMAGYWRSEKLTFVSGTDVTRGWQPTLDHVWWSVPRRARSWLRRRKRRRLGIAALFF